MAPNGEQSLIDLALLSESSTSYVYETICPLGNSDHAGITLSIGMCHNGAGANKKSRVRMVWIYKFANFNKAKNLILSTNWDMFLSDNADLSVENWQNHFLAIMNLCIPRKPLFKKTRPLWLSRYILKLIRKEITAFVEPKEPINHLIK